MPSNQAVSDYAPSDVINAAKDFRWYGDWCISHWITAHECEAMRLTAAERAQTALVKEYADRCESYERKRNEQWQQCRKVGFFLLGAAKAWNLPNAELATLLAQLPDAHLPGICGVPRSDYNESPNFEPAQLEAKSLKLEAEIILARSHFVEERAGLASQAVDSKSPYETADSDGGHLTLGQLDALNGRLISLLRYIESPTTQLPKNSKGVSFFAEIAFQDDLDSRDLAIELYESWAGEASDDADDFRLALVRMIRLAEHCRSVHLAALTCGFDFGGGSLLPLKKKCDSDLSVKIVFLLNHPPPFNFRDYPSACETVEVQKGQGRALLANVAAIFAALRNAIQGWYDVVRDRYRALVDASGWSPSAKSDRPASEGSVVPADNEAERAETRENVDDANTIAGLEDITPLEIPVAGIIRSTTDRLLQTYQYLAQCCASLSEAVDDKVGDGVSRILQQKLTASIARGIAEIDRMLGEHSITDAIANFIAMGDLRRAYLDVSNGVILLNGLSFTSAHHAVWEMSFSIFSDLREHAWNKEEKQYRFTTELLRACAERYRFDTKTSLRVRAELDFEEHRAMHRGLTLQGLVGGGETWNLAYCWREDQSQPAVTRKRRSRPEHPDPKLLDNGLTAANGPLIGPPENSVVNRKALSIAERMRLAIKYVAAKHDASQSEVERSCGFGDRYFSRPGNRSKWALLQSHVGRIPPGTKDIDGYVDAIDFE